MASRVGKYKLSKRDAALSIVDGGTVVGDVIFSAGLSLTGLTSPTATSSLSANQVFRTGSAILSRSIGVGAIAGKPTQVHFDVLCIRNADGSTGGH